MSRSRELARIQADLAARAARTPQEAAERARRGRALVDAALRGEPVPDATAAPSPPRRPVQVVSCARCYGPYEGRPGGLCPNWMPARPLDEVSTTSDPPAT